MWGEETPGRIAFKFCLVIGTQDVITCIKFGDDRWRGFWSAGCQISPFPIDFDGRPYNSATLPRALWCNNRREHCRGAVIRNLLWDEKQYRTIECVAELTLYLYKCKITYPLKTRCKDDVVISDVDKKAELSQRRPRDAPNIWVPWKISRVLTTSTATFPEICNQILLRSILRMCVQNLKFVALLIPDVVQFKHLRLHHNRLCMCWTWTYQLNNLIPSSLLELFVFWLRFVILLSQNKISSSSSSILSSTTFYVSAYLCLMWRNAEVTYCCCSGMLCEQAICIRRNANGAIPLGLGLGWGIRLVSGLGLGLRLGIGLGSGFDYFRNCAICIAPNTESRASSIGLFAVTYNILEQYNVFFWYSMVVSAYLLYMPIPNMLTIPSPGLVGLLPTPTFESSIVRRFAVRSLCLYLRP